MPACRPATPLTAVTAAAMSSARSLDTGGRRIGVVATVAIEMHVVHRDVDLGDLESGHPFDGGDDIAPDAHRQVGDRHPVLGDDVDVDGGLFLPDLDRYALALVDAGARNPFTQCADHPRRAA